MSDNNNFFENLTGSGKSYVDGRVTEVKLKAVKALSQSLSFVCGMLFFIAVLAIALGLFALAMVQWLNSVLGTPYGTLIVAGVFSALALVLFVTRRKIFRNHYVSMFAKLFFDDEKEINSFSDLERAQKQNSREIAESTALAKDTVQGLKRRLSPVKLLSDLLARSSDVIDSAGTVFTSARNLIRNITGRGYSYQEPEITIETKNTQENEKIADSGHSSDGSAALEGAETPRD